MNAIVPQFEIKRSEQINELAKALAKAQGMFTGVEKGHTAKVQTKDGGGYVFDFADLAANLDVVRQPLAECGLSYTQWPVQVGASVGVATLLMHESGQWIEYPPLALHAADTRPQTTGSAITYARRYQLAPILGLAAEADDDGNAASGNQATIGSRESREPRKSLPACPSCGKADSIIHGKAEYGAGLLCYKAKGGCGHSWETPEHPYNEHHKGKKSSKSSSAAPPEDGPFTSSEGALFDSLRDKVNTIANAKQFGMFRAEAAQAYGSKKITAPQLGSLIGALVHKSQSVNGLNELGKWIADVRIEMDSTDAKCFDEVESLIAAKVDQFGAAV